MAVTQVSLREDPVGQLLDVLKFLKSSKQQKEIAEKERESRELYYNVMGRQVSLAEKRHEDTKEMQRRLDTAKAAGLEADTTMLQERLRGFKEMTDEEVKSLYMTDAILKSARAQSLALQAEVNQLKTGLAIAEQRRRMQADVESRIGKATELIDDIGLPSETQILYQQELTGILRSKYAAKDPNSFKDAAKLESDLYKSMRVDIAKERERILKLEVDKEKRGEKAKVVDTRSTALLRYGEIPNKTKYEFGSLQEVETAQANFMPSPEVRQVYYNPVGQAWLWPREDFTGRIIPVAYQKAGYKYMTENRAKRLKVHDAWKAAGKTAPTRPEVNISDMTLQEIIK